MSARELLELRKALERLRDALAEAMRVLDGRESPPSPSDEYIALGDPFGDDARGKKIWKAFGQYTTRN